MSDELVAARAAVSAVKTTNDEELYRLLAARMKAIDRDPTIAGNVAPNVQDAARGIAPADLLKFGKDAFVRISLAGQALVCGSADQGYHLQKLLGSFNTDLSRLTAALTGLLIAQLAIAPAIASVVATLVIGKVAPTSVEALCRVWTAKVGGTVPPATTPGPTPPPAPPPPPAPTTPTGTTPPPAR